MAVRRTPTKLRASACVASLIAAALLAGCGGGGGGGETPAGAGGGGSTPTPPVTLTECEADAKALATFGPDSTPTGVGADIDAKAYPTYHALPLEITSAGTGAGGLVPATLLIPAGVATKGLTPDDIARGQAQAMTRGGVSPAIGIAYTPAQVRAAYGLPDVSTATPAQLGSGQTIYIIDAYHGLNIAKGLGEFSREYGLPECTDLAIPVNTTLPLSAPVVGSGCSFATVEANTSGPVGMTATLPSNDSGWQLETVLDVQWSHAIAPMARIILVEGSTASIVDLVRAVRLAGLMGPGSVSMSFAGSDVSGKAWANFDFTDPGMTYLAATGDAGSEANWPAANPHVLGVSGTRLAFDGVHARSETTWTGTGGGMSTAYPVPAYQAGIAVNGFTLSGRSTGDVSMNADPYTGQYIITVTASSAPGIGTAIVIGGTSLSTPEWAGLVTLANAARVEAGKPVLAGNDIHNKLYAVWGNPAGYAAALADITTGNDGTCATCAAGVGFDVATGLGSPNAAGLTSYLASAAAPATPPTLPTATVCRAYSQAWATTATDGAALTYAVTGAPAGLAVTSAGALTWALPVAGSYPLRVTELSASGTGLVSAVTLTTVHPVILGTRTLSATAGTPYSNALQPSQYQVAGGVISWTFTGGVPTGMTAPGNGFLSWPAPVAGTYHILATAHSSNGAAGRGEFVLTVK